MGIRNTEETGESSSSKQANGAVMQWEAGDLSLRHCSSKRKWISGARAVPQKSRSTTARYLQLSLGGARPVLRVFRFRVGR